MSLNILTNGNGEVLTSSDGSAYGISSTSGNVVQETGQSTTDVMSQKASTDSFVGKLANWDITQNTDGTILFEYK